MPYRKRPQAKIGSIQVILIVAISIVAISLVLSACSTSGSEPTPAAADTGFTSPLVKTDPAPGTTPGTAPSFNPFLSPLAEPVVTKDSDIARGLAVLKGRVRSANTNEPLANTVVRLAEVYYGDAAQEKAKTGGVFALDNAFSPSAISDAEGYFIFTDIAAQDYVLMVGDIFGVWAMVLDDTQEKPKVWSAIEQSVTDLGEVYLDY